jgi:hypothetical protein
MVAKFNDYCFVGIGDNDGVISEIKKISETTPNFLDGKGLVITTFTSAMEIGELTDYFKSFDRNFLIFNLDKSNSGFNITKSDIHDGLFGFLNNDRSDFLKDKSDELLHEVKNSKGAKTFTHSNDSELKLSLDKIQLLTIKERDEWMNIIIDKGLDNLTIHDKELLDELSK